MWCRVPGSNWPPDDYKSTALPNELTRHRYITLVLWSILGIYNYTIIKVNMYLLKIMTSQILKLQAMYC